MKTRDGARERAQAVKLLLLDADGVLTDGSLVFGPGGEEWKSFHSRDGLGIRLAQGAGLEVGIISGRRSSVLERRAAELDLTEVHQGAADKLAVFEALLARRRLAPEATAFLGDDLVDLPVMRKAGFAAAVPEASAPLLAHAHLVTGAAGGRGAVREVIEFLLEAQGRWASVLEKYGAR